MSFIYFKTSGGNRQDIHHKKLANSITANVGDVYKSYDQDTNLATYGAAATPILGILQEIVDSNYNPIVSSTVTAGTAKSSRVTSQATGTGGTYYAMIDASRFSKFSATVSGTLGTTNESDYAGARLDVDSSNTSYGQLLETTATRTIGTPANFYSHGTDVRNTARLVVSISMSELEGVKE